MPKKEIRIKTPLFLFLVVLFSLTICGTASADTYIGGLPLTTVDNGTVSGGVYSDSYYGFTGNATADSTNDIQTGNVTYNFKPLPSNAEVVSATLYTGVYLGNMQTDYNVDVDIDFNGEQLDSQHLSSTYQFLINGGDGLTQVNDHTIRVTSDYFMWYDVTDQLKQNNTVHVDTTKSAFDGRIKLITLIVVYNDGDTDKIAYWINQGQDVSSYLDEEYVGSTSFNGLPSGYTVSNTTLKVIHMASTDGVYQFNGSHMSSSPSAGSYSGFDIWDVTSQYKLGLDNTLTYHKGGGSGLGGYFKIAFAILTTKYSEPQTNLPELQVTEISCNPDSGKIAGKLFSDNSNTIKATVQNTGSAAAGSFKVLLSIGNYTETKTVESLANGASTVISFTGFKPTTNDPVTINVTADSDKQVDEVNETNNLLSQSVNVITSKLPDLVSTTIEVPSNLEINKTYSISATIKNDGFLSSKATKVTLWVDDGSGNKVKVGTADLKALDIDGTATVKFNWKPTTYSTYTLTISVDPEGSVKELDETNNENDATAITKNPDVITIFMTSDNPGTNVLVPAAQEVLELFPGKVDIQIRTGIQIAAMSESELLAYLSSCDIFIGNWVTTDAYNAMAPILKAHPEILDKKVFLILEPPVSTVPASIDSMNLSVINGVKLLEDFSSDQLNDYYLNTMRGTSYNNVIGYLKTVDFPDLYNKGVLYKDLSNSAASKDEILWALSLIGFNTTYNEPPSFSSTPDYGIYRGKWYSYVDDDGTWHSGLEEYMEDYFKDDQPAVGLIESTMYVQAQELQPYEAIIAALEAKGINVIPVVAFGGTKEQLKVMLNAFTNATDIDAFLADPSKYTVNVDAIVSMPAYGLGGNDFSKVSPFISAIDVPIIRAVHSDYETNEQYELGTSGLRNLSGDKWWHIAILEAQGLIDPIFIGGMKNIIDPQTGAVVSGYVPYEGNINMLANTVNGWVQLKHTDNADKKIAMIYFNYPPGKQNVAASYLDPVQSMLNLLNVMKTQGYDVENLPDNVDLLLDEIMAQGVNIANWASGLVEKLANNNESLLDSIEAYQETNTEKLDFSSLSAEQLQNLSDIPGVILYPVDDFMEWFNQLDDLTRLNVVEGPVAYIGELCKNAVELNYNEGMNDKIDSWYEQMYALLPDDKIDTATPILKNITSTLKSYVNFQDSSDYNQYLTYKEQFLALNIEGMSGWGEAPGDIMTVEKNGIKYFVLPGIQFGNVLIAPEPQRGWEGDPEQLYHNCVVPPHYQYLAFYAYLQQQGYDAMVFMGRHATHEWLPGKEVLPAYNDFTSIVTGGVPQVYFYIMDGVSEGLTAKRRGSAVIIDHLTPPMGFTQLYGGMANLENLVRDYDGKDAAGKQEIITRIKQIIKENNLQGDIGVDVDSLEDDDLLATVESYLEDLTTTFYPYGVDVIGQKWTDDQIALLVTSILSVPFEIPGGGTETTSLQNEIALITKGQGYSSLNAGDLNEVQTKCVDVVKELIHSDVNTVASALTTNPTNNLKLALEKANQYIGEINESVENEVNNFINALNGGYIEPGPGNDPINNPDALPTGNNFYQDQAAEIPTKDAYRKASELTLTLLGTDDMTDDTKKIVVGIWDTETARDDGELVSLVLYLLGMEPQWTPSPSAGSGGQKLKEMPIYNELENLVRPDGWEKKRIDVVVVLDGNFRDLFSRQLGLMDKAFKVALARSYYTIIADSTLKAKYGDKVQDSLDSLLESIGYYGLGSESLDDNYVAYDWVQDFQYYMDKGIDYEEAGILAISRIFAPPENDYGADVSQAVRMSWTWENSSELAQNYLDRMGHIYSDTDWGTYNADAFTRALSGASNLYTSRNTNVYGILDNDDFFDYWGGLSMAMKEVNGETPNMYVLKYGNGVQTQAQTLDQFMNRELNSRYYNPDWIQGMMDSGYSGANYMQKFVANMWGWQVTRPESVQNWMWDSVVDVYLNDKYNMGVTEFMESGNNAYAMTSMTGTLLTAAYEGYWKTDDATLSRVANEWAKMVIKNGVACCDCSCGNIAMMKWATTYINPDILAQFKSQLYTATQNEGFAPSSTPSDPNQGGQSGNSGQDNGQGQSSEGTTPGEQVSAATTPGENGEGKAHEISKVGEQSSSQTGMPIAATVGVIALVCLVAIGYFRGRSQGK